MLLRQILPIANLPHLSISLVNSLTSDCAWICLLERMRVLVWSPTDFVVL
jgi:hypothetical protein